MKMPVGTKRVQIEAVRVTVKRGRGKCLNLLFAVVHHVHLLWSSSMFSPLTCRGVDGLMLSFCQKGGVVAPTFYRLLSLNKTLWPAVTLWKEGSQTSLDMNWQMWFGSPFASVSNHPLFSFEPAILLFLPHHQTDDTCILLLFSPIFQHLAHLTAWSSS